MKKPSSASSSYSTNIQYQHTKFPPIHKRASSSQASPQSGLNSNSSTPKNSLIKRPTSAESSSSKHSAQSFELPIGAFLTSLPSSKLNSHRTPGTKRTISTPESSQLSVNVSLTSLEHIPLGTCRSECPSPVTKNVHDDDCISVCSESKIDDLKERMMDEDFQQLKKRLAHLKTIIPNFNIDLDGANSLADDLELEEILKNKDESIVGDECSTDLSELNFSKEELESLQELEKEQSDFTLESEDTKESQTLSDNASQNSTDIVNIGTASDLLTKTLVTPRLDLSIAFSESSAPISLDQDDARRSLEMFMEELKSRKFVVETEDGEIEENLVQLPEDLDLITKSINSEIFEMKDEIIIHLAQANAISKEEAFQEIQPGDTLDSSMKKIHKLDLLLQEIENKGKAAAQLANHIMEEHKIEREKLKKTSLMKYVRDVNKQEKTNGSVRSSSASITRADSGKSLSRKRPTPRTGNKNDSFVKKNMDIREDAIFFKLSEQEEERVRDIIAQDDLQEGAIPYGQGYEPSQIEIQKLANIHEKLKEIVPVERRYLFEGMANYEDGGWKSLNKTMASIVEENFEKGDYLREARIEREHRNKIMDVDEKIAQLYETKVEPLSHDILNELIRQAKIENEMFEKRSRVLSESQEVDAHDSNSK